MFIMTLGGFGDIWNEIPNTKHEVIGNIPITCINTLFKIILSSKLQCFISGKIHWFLFIALLVILLLNLLIAMMGDTYAKVS